MLVTYPYINIMWCLWKFPLGKLGPAIQAGHLRSMLSCALVTLTKQQQTNVPSAELVAFFSQVPPHKPTRRKPPCSLPLYSNKTETSQNNGQVSYQFNPRTKNLFSAVCFLMRHELAGSTVIKLCSRRHRSCTIKPSHASTQALTQN